MTIEDKIFDDKFYFDILRVIILLSLLLPVFFGASKGLKMAGEGVCTSSLIKRNLTSSIAPCAFITTPIMFSLIGFFTIKDVEIRSYNQGCRLLAGATMLGIPGGFTAYYAGEIAKYSIVAVVQQKKFTFQFFVTFIFLEIIPIFGMILFFVIK
ncbi:Vacuolar ATP synthase subunit C [Spraguea lophii 42_110]|uniref:Vacuolar ATP synthase subunit C n=1 Tax=Spraguea lophii (strain 42_110) TaxID=1358809 RepID=S7WAZ2_SPRLO|nr:Vacuolar ATP synthase subunit C [Spraguea lophii 42_110]